MPSLDRDPSGARRSGAPAGGRRLLLIAAAVLAALALAWLGLNLHDHEPPAPLWTERDLPPLPAPEDNGWVVLHDRRGAFAGIDARPAEDAVQTILGNPALLREHLADQLHPSEAAFEDLDEARAICREAFLERARFADACPLEIGASCPAIEILRCHRLLHRQALADAAASRWDDVARTAERLLDRGLDHAGGARTFLGQAVALAALVEDLALAEALPRWAEPSALAGLRAPIAAITRERLRPELGAMGEYLLARRALVEMERAADTGLLGRLLFDPGETLASLNRCYAPVAGGGMPTWQEHTAGFGWWMDNPIGDKLLDALAAGEGASRMLLHSRDEVIQKRDAALAKYVRHSSER
jgi:hypothetical protein